MRVYFRQKSSKKIAYLLCMKYNKLRMAFYGGEYIAECCNKT